MKDDVARLRRAAGYRIIFICVSGFVLSVVVFTGWGWFPALTLLFMAALSSGMMASALSLTYAAREIEREKQES